jgi:DMSO/TMAO reductase YedYZ molybdopterin-dependent catalytic subunit
MESLAVDHARDGEVMIANAMNGGPLPLLNGFPLRLVVPGWYATYWVKMLDNIGSRPDTVELEYVVFADAKGHQQGG